jgi:hypothetical protein
MISLRLSSASKWKWCSLLLYETKVITLSSANARYHNKRFYIALSVKNVLNSEDAKLRNSILLNFELN